MGITTYIKNTMIYPPKIQAEGMDTYLVSGGKTTCTLSGLLIEDVSPSTFKIRGRLLSYGGGVDVPVPPNTTNGKVYLYNNGGNGDVMVSTLPQPNAIVIASFSSDATAITTFESTTSASALQKEKTLSITSTILPNTTVDINTAGVGYLVSGDNITLGATNTIFNTTKGMFVMRNGVVLLKGVDVVHVSQNEVMFPQTLEVGDTIVFLV